MHSHGWDRPASIRLHRFVLVYFYNCSSFKYKHKAIKAIHQAVELLMVFTRASSTHFHPQKIVKSSQTPINIWYTNVP